MKRDQPAVLLDKRELSADALLLTFESQLLSEAAPGQFTMVRVGPGVLLRRPYSFCSLDRDRGRFSLLVKVVGRGTRLLAEHPLGRAVDCLGPLGSRFELPPGGARAAMIAGGVGIAPFIALSQELAATGRSGLMLLGGRARPDLYLLEEFERLGMEVQAATEDGSYGRPGLVTELLPEALSGGPLHLYSCGPSAMLVRVAAFGFQRRLPHQVSVERRMGCGMGCCLGCVVFTRSTGESAGEYRRACTEGPVFRAEEIDWERDPCPM
jgi:dihydroorotate dehydrogenase electron transfer subunit